VLRPEHALDELRRALSERPVLVQQVHLDVEARELLIDRAPHRGDALGPPLPRDDRRGQERACDRAAARRSPEPRAIPVLEHHHHLDVPDPAKRLGERSDPRRSRTTEDRARDVGEREVERRPDHQAAARLIERRRGREVHALELLERVVAEEPRAQRAPRTFGGCARGSASIREHPADPVLGERRGERLLVGAVEDRVETRHVRRVHQRRAAGSHAEEVALADHRHAPEILEVTGEVCDPFDPPRAPRPETGRQGGDDTEHDQEDGAAPHRARLPDRPLRCQLRVPSEVPGEDDE
jgi:hypothetical protein